MKSKIINKKYIKYLLMFFGFFIVFCINAIYNYIQTGDFLAYFHISSHHYTNLYGGVTRDPAFYPKALINFDVRLDPREIFDINFFPHTNFGYFYYFVIIAMLYITIKKVKPGYFLILWTMVLWFYLQFGSMSLTNYIIIHRLYRFLAVIMPPSIVCLGYFIYELKNTRLKFLSVIIPIFLLITSMGFVDRDSKENNSCIRDMREASSFLGNLPQKTIYAEGQSWGPISYYLKYKWDVKSLESVSNLTEINDSYVYIGGLWACACTPNWEHDIPSNWELLKTIDGRIDSCRPRDAEIYLAP